MSFSARGVGIRIGVSTRAGAPTTKALVTAPSIAETMCTVEGARGMQEQKEQKNITLAWWNNTGSNTRQLAPQTHDYADATNRTTQQLPATPGITNTPLWKVVCNSTSS